MQIELIALHHQVAVYKDSVARPKLQPADRLLWLWLSRLWSGWQQALEFVQPLPFTCSESKTAPSYSQCKPLPLFGTVWAMLDHVKYDASSEDVREPRLDPASTSPLLAQEVLQFLHQLFRVEVVVTQRFRFFVHRRVIVLL